MFKKGCIYTRKDVGWIVLPKTGRPKGGHWDTGYLVVRNLLIVFMNIGVPGKTNHDFDNEFDEHSGLITWFGRPKSHTGQPIFQKLSSGALTPHFFARWDNKNPNFTYLGTASILDIEDGAVTKTGINAVKVMLHIDDAEYLLPRTESTPITKQSGFLLEKHLEDFLVSNWKQTPLSKNYEILSENGKIVGQQYRTNTGPLDLLAISHDKSHYLVIELKRDRASDEVVGQILRYMGWVQKNLCNKVQTVKGKIIALRGDEKLEHALYLIDDIDFLKYEINFRLTEEY